MNSVKTYTHKNFIDIRIDEKGCLFKPVNYQNNTSTFAIFWEDKGSKLSLKIEKKNKLIQFFLKEGRHDDQKEILEIEVDIKEELKEGEYTNLKETVKCFGKCKFIFKTKFVNTLITIWNKKYRVILNKEANIFRVLKIMFEDCPESYKLYLNSKIVDEFKTLEDCPEEKTAIVEILAKLLMKSLSGTGPDINMISIISHNVIIKVLKKKLNCDHKFIKVFDRNKNFISPEIDKINRDHFKANNPTDPYCLYYEINSIMIKCVSIENNEDFFEITASVEDKVKDIKEQLKKELKIENKEIIIFQDDIWLGDRGKIQKDKEFQYFVASKINTINIGEVLGRGASSTVYKCTVISTNEELALKQFTMTSGMDQECEGFTNDLQILSKLGSHPNIISLHGLYLDHDHVYIAMEYMSRGTLYDYLERNGPQNEDKIKYFTSNLLQGLQFLHKNKIMHRDLKSPNILLNENDEPKLSDFGISKLLADKSTNALSKDITQTNLRGSYRWMAPEVINGTKYGLNADVWSLGVVVTEMITGKIPFHEMSEEYMVLLKVANDKRIDYESPTPLSEKLQDFLNACLQPDNSERVNVSTLLKSAFITL